ncbi:MAG: YwaF family protein [Bacteroidaceae bacterium]|nr:YwaF family protein [Bacteroidaceae bacterium]
MKWGFFGVVHIATLIVAVLLILGLYLILRNRSAKTQTAVLFLLSLSGIAAVIWNLVQWGSPLEYLPLHLCALNAMVLPVAVLTKNKTLGNLLLIWALGALAAIVVNNAQAEYELTSMTFIMYYFPHVLEFGIPVLLFKLGLIEKHPRYIWSSVGITMGTYTLIHFANLGINAHCSANNVLNPSGELIQVNYMYSLVPENPVFDLFWKLIPHPYWYLYLVIPILIVYLTIVYTPQFFKKEMKTTVVKAHKRKIRA